MRIKLLLVLFLSLFFAFSALAIEEKKVVRVAISDQNFSRFNHKNVKISSKSPIKIIDLSQQNQSGEISENKVVEIIMGNSLFQVFVDDELKYENLQGPLLISSNSQLELLDLNRKGQPAKYNGMFELRLYKDYESFNLINIVDMQNYLKGVVPNEMPVSFGLEALKAQAIAARNYALNANMDLNYDLVDSTAAQVYYGANSYREITDKAVDETNGIYALYNEKPIMAQYFSTSGGITDNWVDVFAQGNMPDLHPYLKSRPDFDKQKPLKSEDDVVEFYSKKDNGLDINSPKFRWSFEFDRKELEEILHTTLQQQSKAGLVEPKYDGDIKLIGLKEIKPLKRTQSGKITELLISTKEEDYVVKKELGIRRVLKKNNTILPSANFFIETKGKENLEVDTEGTGIKLFDSFGDDKYPEKFIITGGGFGHGVGMSQFGASNLAKMGKKYPEILKHYYTGINISTVPKEVLYNEHNMSYKT